jgi:16S rRNA (cytidine1402-2'-O)-methyltransferase
MSETGRLVLCATPIGNLGDVSRRLGEELAGVDVIYAEDTRRTRVLLDHLGVTTSVRSLFVGNEVGRTSELLHALGVGKSVALVTDAGMPGISDPGSEVVKRARQHGHQVTSVPGPSAVTTALALSGFSGDRFSFEGFLPRKGAERTVRLTRIAADDRPTVLFVSPHRFVSDLSDLAEHTGPTRRIAVARELTKLHEEVWTGSVAEALTEWSERSPKGEFTIVIAPGTSKPISLDDARVEAAALVAGGMTSSDAARQVARDSGLNRRDIYQALISAQDRS